jgi:hypothetical protein
MRRTWAMRAQLRFGESLHAGLSLHWDQEPDRQLGGRGRVGGGRFMGRRMGRETSGVPRQRDV